jgi:hypothetical protein
VSGAGLDAAAHLDALAKAVADAGLQSRSRYDQTPAVLQVWHPALPVVGESVTVTAGPDGQPGYRSSLGDVLAPCTDPARAVAALQARVHPDAIAAMLAGGVP